uniref:RING-type domain-containing protein n=1 Tax=viral metagenome TaxID=1070528 RepID=A0A6C0B7R9_9ZZZZ
MNNSSRLPVPCPYCDFTACRTCCETYVLGETSSKCMNPPCNKEWTRQFINSKFTNVFVTKKLKKRREEILFDIERSLLPATQPLVERILKRENITNQMRDVREKICVLNRQKWELQNQLYRLNSTNASTERAEFVRACPDEDCRGFLSTQWKCGLCEKWSCPECHEVKGHHRDEPHECNPDTLATARLLSNDTKPCPNCRTGIFKIDGCDQMWCTQCHTAFNWRTGRVETAVHNPHYFEWLRRNGNVVPRNPLDNPCQNEITHQNYIRINNLLKNNYQNDFLSRPCNLYMEKLIRNIVHLRYVILPRYEILNRERRNENLRISYMRNMIDANKFKITLQRNEKKYEKNREIRNILDILKSTVTDIVYRFIAYLENDIRCLSGRFDVTILEEIDPIVDYANGCLNDISKVYSSKRLEFSNELREK